MVPPSSRGLWWQWAVGQGVDVREGFTEKYGAAKTRSHASLLFRVKMKQQEEANKNEFKEFKESLNVALILDSVLSLLYNIFIYDHMPYEVNNL